jgi:Domain of unknown function (DUF4865)
MQAMQYEITLPADYDMAIVRRRVATKGAMTDDFEGLGLKAYGIRERGVNGSPVNQYAPFYLWASGEGMNRFLWGAGFGGLSRDFGRPVVRQWTGLAFERGPASDAAPSVATRRIEPIARDADATAAIDAAVAATRERARASEVHSTALAVDTSAWEIVQFTLWAGRAAGASGTADAVPANRSAGGSGAVDASGARAVAPDDEATYEVLHLSSPRFDDLKVGRQW